MPIVNRRSVRRGKDQYNISTIISFTKDYPIFTVRMHSNKIPLSYLYKQTLQKKHLSSILNSLLNPFHTCESRRDGKTRFDKANLIRRYS